MAAFIRKYKHVVIEWEKISKNHDLMKVFIYSKALS
jgi:hypothetical protein